MAPRPLAEFTSVASLCRYAWGVGRIKGYPRPSYELHSRGTNPSDLSLQDRIADGAMLRQFVLRQLGYRGKQVIVARYGRENSDLERMSRWLVSELRYPRLLLLDHSVRFWADMRQHHTGVWWSRHLGKDTKTIWRWCRDAEGRSGLALLTEWLDDAHAKIEQPARDRGYVDG